VYNTGLNCSKSGADRLKNEYLLRKIGYQSQPYVDGFAFDAKLVENVIGKIKRGKATGLDNITCVHVLFSPAL